MSGEQVTQKSESGGNNYPNRWKILAVVLSMTFMACVDASIVNVAIHTISESLAVDLDAVSWVVTSYLIAVSATVLVFGRLGDKLSKVLVFKFGIVVFTIGSLLCGLASSLVFLLVARVIQGIGAAASMATNQGIITQVFPAQERGRALGMTGSSVALGNLLGPALGGFLVAALDWHSIFLVNIPIGVIVFFLGQRVLPRRAKGDWRAQQSWQPQQSQQAAPGRRTGEGLSKERIDGLGAVLSMAVIVLFILAINFYREWGLTDPRILGMFAGAVVLMALFLLIEKHHAHPLVDLGMFKNRLYSLSIFCSFISFVTLSFMTIIIPFYLQDVLKISSFLTGLLMMTGPLVMMVVAPLSGYASDKIGSEWLTFIGQFIMVLGLAAIGIFFTEASPAWLVVLLMAVVTMGSAVFQSPNTNLIMSQVTGKKLGVAGSINALMRNVGMVTGISLSTSLLYFFMSSQLGYRVEEFTEGHERVFANALHGVFWVAAALCLIGVVLTGMRLQSMRKEKEPVRKGGH